LVGSTLSVCAAAKVAAFERFDVVSVRFIAGAALLALAGGCSSYGGLDPNSTSVQVTDVLPPPDLVTMQQELRTYRIGPFDTISVEVFGADALKSEGLVGASGTFGVPLIGQVQAGGLTTVELSDLIAERLRGRYLRNPQVSVTVKEVRSQRVTVDGAVKQPGIYPVIGRMTLQQAIATARGTDEFARLSQVAVFRTVGTQQMAALFDLKGIREGRQVDPEIYGNDVVIVGENLARRIFKEAAQTLPVLGVFQVIR
jgi:polysaccharide export outer membrane protein